LSGVHDSGISNFFSRNWGKVRSENEARFSRKITSLWRAGNDEGKQAEIGLNLRWPWNCLIAVVVGDGQFVNKTAVINKPARHSVHATEKQ
jgi:hypothetical protein